MNLFLVTVMYMIIDGGVERVDKFSKKRFVKK